MRVLIENPIILMILIGIISSLFNRVKNSQPDDGKGHKQNPKRSGLPSGQHRKFEQGDRSNKPVREQKTKARMADHGKDLFDPLFVNTKMQAEENTQTEFLADNQKNIEIPGTERTQTKKTLEIDQTKLIDGLIWSEVLGPPRAKKTHQSFKAYGKKQ